MVEQMLIEEPPNAYLRQSNCADGVPLCMLLILAIGFIAYGCLMILRITALAWYHLVLLVMIFYLFAMASTIKVALIDLFTKVYKRCTNNTSSENQSENGNLENLTSIEEPQLNQIKNVFNIDVENEGFPRTFDPILNTDTAQSSSYVIKNHPKKCQV